MKTKAKISGYVVRGAAVAGLSLSALVTLSSAFNLPNSLLTSAVPLHFSGNGPGTLNQARTLSFAERVAYERAIEDVYWRHRIWPKESPDPKPSLDAVMSQAQLETKVEDYLRNSQALDDYWQRPLTAEQLQAEMERMAQHTRQPDVLRELFEALGNDPFVIAECLARPALADRLVTNWYAYDERFHSELKQRAEADLQAHPAVEQMKQTSGTYSEIELARSDNEEENSDAEASVKLTNRQWSDNVQKLAAMFGHASNSEAQIKTGVLSSLQEDENRYYATAVINETKDRLRLATVEWRKEPLESWRARAENQMPNVMAAVGANYTLPEISDAGNGCTDDTWTATNHPPIARFNHTAVWTGSEMIVWGGTNGSGDFNTGGRYNPSTDSWATTSTINAPSARAFHTAVWTGSEMIVWGGSGGTNTGGRYNPSTNSWTATSTTGAPSARIYHTAVWTGSQMIVWGGHDGYNYLNTGGRYNPSTDSWAATNTTNAPSGRAGHTAVWTGSEMIVWSGTNSFGYAITGGRYNPGTNSWIATSTINAPSARSLHTAVWTGNEMIVWGGDDSSGYSNSGGRYNPATNSWTATSTTNAPSVRYSHTAVWTGSEMIVWGGVSGIDVNTGGRYNPGTDSWTATSTTNAPSARDSHTAVWTGTEMIIWGGSPNYNSSGTDTGGRYNPSTDMWATTSNAPLGRTDHTAVWTGSEMIVWGGHDDSYADLNTGERYNPSTDSWTATSTINAPSARSGHRAVWTGSEMIVWGGDDSSGFSNTGGRYNPGTDSWTATSTTNAPSARDSHTAVWTGSEMIVWGGSYFDGTNHFYLNTGGRYHPSTDSWTATSTTNAPSGRKLHTAVRTGSEMIVWGGNNGDLYFNTGGRYNLSTDSWAATSTVNAPSARDSHTAVRTGSEMIIWGGDNLSGYLNTGGRYNPGTNSWTATTTSNAPSGRIYHTAVWTGSEMIVWGGGTNGSSYFNTGGRYNPSRDLWRTTSTINAPFGRELHTAVWTGSEMIVWGGDIVGGVFDTGGRYCAQLTPTGPPVVTTNPATNITSVSATLNGSLNPNGLTTTVYFEYGTTTSYGLTTPVQTQTGNTVRNISANTSVLSASTTYHFRIVTANSYGIRHGVDKIFTTLSATGPPVVTTNPANNVASFSATLNGSVDPHGLSTSVYFQYGATNSYGSTTPAQAQGGSRFRNISANIAGLSASTTYHFRIVATNSAGTRYGSDRTFTTLSATGPPVVITNLATLIASFSAKLNGSLDPHGLTTTVYFQYGTTTSYGLTTASQSQTGNTFRNISATIGGLSASTTYHFRIVATNSAGTRYGSDRTFRTLSGTGPPVVVTNPATNVGTSSATLNGSVDPHGLSTNVHFLYGTTTSYGSTTPSQTKTGNTYQSVTANIGGLSAGFTYHFRIVASNGAGTSYGSDQAFTTP